MRSWLSAHFGYVYCACVVSQTALAVSAADSILAEVEPLFEAKSYSQVVARLARHLDVVSTDYRLSYFYGTSERSLGDLATAETYLKISVRLNRSFVEARWQLAQVYLERKNWERAEANLRFLSVRLPAEPQRLREMDYLLGVTAYQQENYGECQDRMTRALLWGPDLDPRQKNSAESFLTNASGKRTWTAALPLGLSWDGNLWRNSAAAPASSKKSLARTLIGALVSRNLTGNSAEPGWNTSASANVILSNTVDRADKNLDFSVVGFTLAESYAGEGSKENPNPWRGSFSQSASVIALGKTLNTAETGVSFSGGFYEIGAGFEYDIATRANNRSEGTSTTPQDYYTGKQALYAEVNSDSLKFGADILIEERLSAAALSDSLGDTFAVTLTPRLQRAVFSGRTTARLETAFAGIQETFGARKFTMRATPLLGVRWYMAPWVLWNASATFEISRSKAENLPAITSTRPAASLMATMLL
jgi:tetratricopeptide (TPR) repeat protein